MVEGAWRRGRGVRQFDPRMLGGGLGLLLIPALKLPDSETYKGRLDTIDSENPKFNGTAVLKMGPQTTGVEVLLKHKYFTECPICTVPQ